MVGDLEDSRPPAVEFHVMATAAQLASHNITLLCCFGCSLCDAPLEDSLHAIRNCPHGWDSEDRWRRLLPEDKWAYGSLLSKGSNCGLMGTYREKVALTLPAWRGSMYSLSTIWVWRNARFPRVSALV